MNFISETTKKSFSITEKLINIKDDTMQEYGISTIGKETLDLKQWSSYFSHKLIVKQHKDKGGLGVFVTQPIQAGELLVEYRGYVVSYEELQRSSIEAHLTLQVEDNQILVPFAREPGDRVNHSCTPNVGMKSATQLVAMRDIAVGEEICFDYAMTDSIPYDEFACSCDTPYCRGRVTGDDWSYPELWQRYRGYFSPYLQRRIDRLKSIGDRK
jgi:uncharacterized protein